MKLLIVLSFALFSILSIASVTDKKDLLDRFLALKHNIDGLNATDDQLHTIEQITQIYLKEARTELFNSATAHGLSYPEYMSTPQSIEDLRKEIAQAQRDFDHYDAKEKLDNSLILIYKYEFLVFSGHDRDVLDQLEKIINELSDQV